MRYKREFVYVCYISYFKLVGLYFDITLLTLTNVLAVCFDFLNFCDLETLRLSVFVSSLSATVTHDLRVFFFSSLMLQLPCNKSSQ